MGWEVGRRVKREGTYVYLWLIHVNVWQRPTQNCKAIILQLKINKFLKKEINLPFLPSNFYSVFGTFLTLCSQHKVM